LGNYPNGIEPKHVRNMDKLNDIETPLATFKACDKRLIFAQTECEFGLRHSDNPAPLDDQLDQGAMALRSKSLVQPVARNSVSAI
jgi:hypothetical protein